MDDILHIYKPVGLTPLELITQLRLHRPDLRDTTLGYAGRLDPMAHGVMLIMVGDATKQFNRYKGYDKVYECSMVLGFKTDTYDILGLADGPSKKIVNLNTVNKIIAQLPGTQLQPYPPFSSVRVQGKALFEWAKLNKLQDIAIPTHQIKIHESAVLRSSQISAAELLLTIQKKIVKVNGDFRQQEILLRWEELLTPLAKTFFNCVRFRISCSSGTYIRSLVEEIGSTLGSGAVALEILRTQAGPYSLETSTRLP